MAISDVCAVYMHDVYVMVFSDWVTWALFLDPPVVLTNIHPVALSTEEFEDVQCFVGDFLFWWPAYVVYI